ncbi:MAG: PAC2 family protein, partial [Actinomycetes bacterium]
AGRTSWVGALEVPGHVSGLLELRLGRSGHQAMGFAAHVPHYLAGTEYPRAALALLEAVSAATGLLLPLDALREAADRTDAETDAQIAQNPENVKAVTALEQQYDAFVAKSGGVPGSAAGGDGTPIPSGEEIAAQVEQFLAEMDERGRDDQQ